MIRCKEAKQNLLLSAVKHYKDVYKRQDIEYLPYFPVCFFSQLNMFNLTYLNLFKLLKFKLDVYKRQIQYRRRENRH